MRLHVLTVMTVFVGLQCSDQVQDVAPSGVGGELAEASASDTAATPDGAPSEASANVCALQGNFIGHVTVTLSNFMCGGVPFGVDYQITVAGKTLTLTDTGEGLPMVGTIDERCKGHVLLTKPLKREFDLTFDPSAKTASGTYVDGDPDACPVVYGVSIRLDPAE
jgi:hypothetical protein